MTIFFVLLLLLFSQQVFLDELASTLSIEVQHALSLSSGHSRSDCTQIPCGILLKGNPVAQPSSGVSCSLLIQPLVSAYLFTFGFTDHFMWWITSAFPSSASLTTLGHCLIGRLAHDHWLSLTVLDHCTALSFSLLHFFFFFFVRLGSMALALEPYLLYCDHYILLLLLCLLLVACFFYLFYLF